MSSSSLLIKLLLLLLLLGFFVGFFEDFLLLDLSFGFLPDFAGVSLADDVEEMLDF